MGKSVIRRISATPGPVPEIDTRERLTMLIDVTTCIGCKACEVACQEWNGLSPETTVNFGTYQTAPDMTPNLWNLIKFNEVEEDGRFQWLMRKDMCMHCQEPGCLLACPAPGAIVQYTNGIVDFKQENCIGCQYCVTGCPFNIPKFEAKSEKVFKCTMCVDRVEAGLGPACVKACPTGCLKFGRYEDMKEYGDHRAGQLKADGFANAGVYDPQGVGGTNVIYVLHHEDKPTLYGGLPKNPQLPAALTFWKGPLKIVGNVLMVGSVFTALLHYMRHGPARVEEKPEETVEKEIRRYSMYERLLHWSSALTFLYLMISGLALWSPRLAWLSYAVGGGELMRAWHPWVGVAFVATTLLMVVTWFKDLLFTPNDRVWLAKMRKYIAHEEEGLPPAGRFNAGQKGFYWAESLFGLLLLLSGIPLWFPASFSAELRQLSIVAHSSSAVLAILGLIVHAYMGTLGVPGSFKAMAEGKVSRAWARAHHRAWYDEVAGPEKK